MQQPIYLLKQLGEEPVEIARGAVHDVEAAIALLEYSGDRDAAVALGAFNRGRGNPDHVLSHDDAALLATMFRALPDRLLAKGIVGDGDILDDAMIDRLAASDVARYLELSPQRGSARKHAMNERLGNIVAVAELLERAIAEKLVIVLG